MKHYYKTPKVNTCFRKKNSKFLKRNRWAQGDHCYLTNGFESFSVVYILERIKISFWSVSWSVNLSLFWWSVYNAFFVINFEWFYSYLLFLFFSDFWSSFEIVTPSFSISKGLFVSLLLEVSQHNPCITNSLLKILSFPINFYHLFYLFSEKKETVSYLQKYKKELLKIL